jgi:hypothetical protein|nr:MAG TPA: SMODS and SLOG-associating 2TM effector domain family 5 [Bacteriophage sp.]
MNNISNNTIKNSHINSNNSFLSKRNKGVIILSVISIILSLASFITIVAVKINYNLEMVSLLSIIGFIGILATFVVVSNFSQVNRIESKMETKISELNKAVSKLLIIEEDIKQIRIEIDKINSRIEKEQENVVAIGEKIKTNGLNKQVYNLAKSIQKWTETAQNIQKWAEFGQNIQESS